MRIVNEMLTALIVKERQSIVIQRAWIEFGAFYYALKAEKKPNVVTMMQTQTPIQEQHKLKMFLYIFCEVWIVFRTSFLKPVRRM